MVYFFIIYFQQQDDNGPNHSRGGDWLNVIIPSSPNSQSQHRMSYLIRNLDPGTHYQAEVASKNRFGWSAVSERFQFSTRDPGKTNTREIYMHI